MELATRRAIQNALAEARDEPVLKLHLHGFFVDRTL